MKGGYSIIDAKGLNLLAGEKVTIAGIRKECETALAAKKLVLVENCKWATSDMTAIPVMLNTVGDDLIATASTLQIYVDKNDGVEVHNMLA